METEPAILILEKLQDSADNQPKYFISQQNAKELQQRSLEAKRLKKLAMEAAKNAPLPIKAENPKLAIVEAELSRVAKMMSSCEDASDYHKLANARGTLFKEWQVLSGTPNPGARKAGRTPKPAMVQPEPIIETGSNEPNG